MATDADTPAADLVWSPAGGADSGHFTLDERGVLRFAVPKDYEAPDDAGGDGTYELTVQVSDGTKRRHGGPPRVARQPQRGADGQRRGGPVRCAGRRDRHPARRWGGPRRGRHASVRVDADRQRHGHAVDAGRGHDHVHSPDRAHRGRGADVHPACDRRGRPLSRGHGGGHRRRQGHPDRRHL